MSHVHEDLIHDFVGDELTGDERARVARHLAECLSCRAIAESARSLREEAVLALGGAESADLEADTAVSEEAGVSDLWPAIEARIRAGVRTPPEEPPQGVYGASAPAARSIPDPRPATLRAAAVVLLVLASSVTMYVLIRSGGTAGRESDPNAGIPSAASAPGALGGGSANAIAVAYAPVFAELEALVAEGRDRLQPETVARLEANLEILDGAIRDIQEALAIDPAHGGNLRSLDGMFQTKLGLLLQAIDLTRGARSELTG